jgi:hypothetical protein
METTMPTDMRKALKQAALLRNLIETCLRASPAPMTGGELFEWPSIKEQIGVNTAAYSRLSTQLQKLVKERQVAKIGKGSNTTYAWITERSSKESTPSALTELNIRVNKAQRTISLTFEGLHITIGVDDAAL